MFAQASVRVSPALLPKATHAAHAAAEPPVPLQRWGAAAAALRQGDERIIYVFGGF